VIIFYTRQLPKSVEVIEPINLTVAGSAISNRREHRSYLGQVFNSKLGCIATPGSKCMVCLQPFLKLKTQPKVRPVS
jgi:hypothetical protein